MIFHSHIAFFNNNKNTNFKQISRFVMGQIYNVEKSTYFHCFLGLIYCVIHKKTESSQKEATASPTSTPHNVKADTQPHLSPVC